MIDTTTDDAAMDAWDSEGGSQLDDAQRIFHDRRRYQSRELEHVLGSTLVLSANGDHVCQLSSELDDDESIVRAID